MLEDYLRWLCVIGVDLFFFVSVYSFMKKDRVNYKEFIINRVIHVYLKFILFYNRSDIPVSRSNTVDYNMINFVILNLV